MNTIPVKTVGTVDVTGLTDRLDAIEASLAKLIERIADIADDLPQPEPEPEPEPIKIAHVIDLADGEQTLNIPRSVRSPDKWVVVRGSREAVITGLNHVSTPSLIRFEGVTLRPRVRAEHILPRIEGVTGGEFTFIDCHIDVVNAICWNVSKATVIGCDITTERNVFAGNVRHYVARNNTVLQYSEDLWRGGTGEMIDTVIVKHVRKPGHHPDVFEIARNSGFRDITIRNVSGPEGKPAQLYDTQGIAGGDITNAVFENINIQMHQASGISAVQVGGLWKDVTFKNVNIAGASIRVGDDYQAVNVTVIHSPGLEVLR